MYTKGIAGCRGKRHIDLRGALNAKEPVSANLAGSKNERERERDGRNAIQRFIPRKTHI